MAVTKQASTPVEETPQKKKKNVGYRVLAGLIALSCLCMIVMPLRIIRIDPLTSGFMVNKYYAFDVFHDLFTSNVKTLGFIPTIAGTSAMGNLITFSQYFFLLSIVIGLLLCVIALFTAKASPSLTRWAILVITWGAAVYSVVIFAASSYIPEIKTTPELWTVIVVIIGAFLYFCLMLAKLKGRAWINALQFIMTLAVTVFLFMAIINKGTITPAFNRSGFAYKLILLLCVGGVITNILVATFTAMGKATLIFELLRILFQMVVTLGIAYVNYASDASHSYFHFAFIAAVITLAQIFFIVLEIIYKGSAKFKEASKNFIDSFTEEEYVEVCEYDGGPVAGVRIAEEAISSATNASAVNGASTPAALHPNGISYEFYNRSFDPFLSGLSNQERAEFVDLYIVKCRGAMPEIPAYEVGGDNKEFFRSVFVYLGQYREKIPNGLLSKMYDYSLKIDK